MSSSGKPLRVWLKKLNSRSITRFTEARRTQAALYRLDTRLSGQPKASCRIWISRGSGYSDALRRDLTWAVPKSILIAFDAGRSYYEGNRLPKMNVPRFGITPAAISQTSPAFEVLCVRLLHISKPTPACRRNRAAPRCPS